MKATLELSGSDLVGLVLAVAEANGHAVSDVEFYDDAGGALNVARVVLVTDAPGFKVRVKESIYGSLGELLQQVRGSYPAIPAQQTEQR